MSPAPAQGALITDPEYFGSLTAVRDLGRSGHSVDVVDVHRRLSRSAASRYCTRRLQAPAEPHTVAAIEWLRHVGRETPGRFLYPTSDDMAWRIAQSQDVLREHFLLYQPAATATLGLLDKKQLYAFAERCGVLYPRTWAPGSQADVRDLAATLTREAAFPVIVKPRTQAGGPKAKGDVVESPQDLMRAVDLFRRPGAYSEEFRRAAPDGIQWPLVQQFMPEASANTYSVSGFIDRSGSVLTARASTKVFQIPVRIGIGIAFEGRAVRRPQIDAIESLARASGYFGAFEVEFIHSSDGQLYLMDFNPRYYGQMNFEVSRGMRLPSIAYAAAVGDDKALQLLVTQSESSLRSSDATVERFCDQFMFRMLLRAQSLKGRLAPGAHRTWLQWMEAGELSDFLTADDDPAPAKVDQTTRRRHWLRHPLSTYRMLFR